MLKISDHAKFQGYDGRVIFGKVVGHIKKLAYIVAGDNSICGQYRDGLYRFNVDQVIKNGSYNS